MEKKILECLKAGVKGNEGNFGEPVSRGWNIPTSSDCPEMSKKMKRANRYLKIMENIIQKKIDRNPEEGGKTFERFTRRSRVGTLYILNQVDPHYFLKMSPKELKGILKGYVEKMRMKKYKMDIQRIYVQKENGKMRPIGSPKLDSKMVYSTINMFLEKGLSPKIGNYQHGFRKGRGPQSVMVDIMYYINKGFIPFGFDLTSFFNRLNAEIIGRNLKKEIEGLGDGIRFMTRYTFPKFKEILQDDKEIILIDIKEGIERGGKTGFTQGANTSPIISTYALELAQYQKIDGLVMYADDGVIFRKEEEDVNIDRPKGGIKMNHDKSEGWTTQLKFMNLKLDLEKRLAWNYKEETQPEEFRNGVPFEDHSMMAKLIMFTKYGKVDKPKKNGVIEYGKSGIWKVKNGSILTILNINGGTRYYVTETGVSITNEMYARTYANDLAGNMISSLDQWDRSQRLIIKPPKDEASEGNKLFNINVKIGNKLVQQRVGS